MDGTDNLCQFGLASEHTGCTGVIGAMASGENHNGRPLVEGRVCRACNNVVVAVRLYSAQFGAALGAPVGQHHINVMVTEWVTFVTGGESPIGEQVENNRKAIEAANNMDGRGA